jgi:hypothetical protein
VSLIPFGAAVAVARRRLRQGEERFALALGLGASIHPLVFSYAFALAFPLAVLSADRVLFGNHPLLLKAKLVAGLCAFAFLDRLVPVPEWVPVRALGIWLMAACWLYGSGRENAGALA